MIGASEPLWVLVRLLLKVDALVFVSLKLSVSSGAEWTTVERARKIAKPCQLRSLMRVSARPAPSRTSCAARRPPASRWKPSS